MDAMFACAGDWDTAVTTLRLDGGALATIDNSRKAVYGQDQRVEVFGSGGMVTSATHTIDRVVHATGSGTVAAPLVPFFPERYLDAYRLEVQAFVDAVRHGSPAPVTGQDGREAVVLALAVAQSVAEGRVVSVSR